MARMNVYKSERGLMVYITYEISYLCCDGSDYRCVIRIINERETIQVINELQVTGSKYKC